MRKAAPWQQRERDLLVRMWLEFRLVSLLFGCAVVIEHVILILRFDKVTLNRGISSAERKAVHALRTFSTNQARGLLPIPSIRVTPLLKAKA